MKLRNKKTGELVDFARRGLLKSDNDNHIIVYPEGTLKYYAYDSLAELNEEWEDYKPAEPLIKDEKKHKIIRACASLDSVEDVKVVKRSSDDTTTLIFGLTTLTLKGREEYASLQQCGTYTITELCGEEKK